MLEGFPIVGGGPAGAAAALAMAQAGGRPVIYEKSSFPRHKLCGEFFSPESLPLLAEIGAADGFLAWRPARVTHTELNFERYSQRFPLPERGYGLSRYAFDDLLLRTAMTRGAELRRERAAQPNGPAICATGRRIVGRPGRRLFGFKAHFSGPANDAVELYFFPGGYCGLCPIEGGRTNVCGLAGEDLLRHYGFRVDQLAEAIPRLRERLAPLARVSCWHMAGPLRFGHASPAGRDGAPVLAAGDATCFVDPFTGTGLLAALQTGVWAGEAALRAAEGARWSDCCAWHRRRCAGFFRRQLATTGMIRLLLRLGWVESLAGVVPGSVLFRLTRPSV